MRLTSKLLVVASFVAASFVIVQLNNQAQAVDPPTALNKPINQFRSPSRSGFYNDYNYQTNNYNYQTAPVERRSYSVAPEASADVPPPAPGTYEQSDCAAAPQAMAERRGYSYQPQPDSAQRRSYSYEPQPEPVQQYRSYRTYRSYRSGPSYELPRAMRNK